jgi:ankyrin repeat protein
MADVMQTKVSGERSRHCLVLSTSLYLACLKGYTNIARILLEHHADPHRCDIHGHSPFTVAKQKGFKEILDCRVQSGKQYIKVIDHCLYTCLHLY